MTSLFPDREVEEILDQTIEFKRSDKSEIMVFGLTLRDAVEKFCAGRTLENLLGESVPWSEETFPQSTAQSVEIHLLREWKELMASGFNDPSEFADVLLLLAHLAHKKGFSLVDAGYEKFALNLSRRWGEVDSEGVVEHIRSDKKWQVIDIQEEPMKPVFHFMRLDKDGRPYGIGNTGEVDFRQGKLVVEIGDDGKPTGREGRYRNHDGAVEWDDGEVTYTHQGPGHVEHWNGEGEPPF